MTDGGQPITTASPPTPERFEDRLLDAFLDRFEDIRGICWAPGGTLLARRPHRGPIALTLLAVVAAGSLGVALALHFATSPDRHHARAALDARGLHGLHLGGVRQAKSSAFPAPITKR